MNTLPPNQVLSPQVCRAEPNLTHPDYVVYSAMGANGGSAGTMNVVIQSESRHGGRVQTLDMAHSDGTAMFSDNCSLIRVTVIVRDPRQSGRTDLCEACYNFVKQTKIFVWSDADGKFLEGGS